MTTAPSGMHAPNVALTSGRLTMREQPALIQAGALHYFRLPHPDLWPDLLARFRMAGLNAAFVPLPWAYHSPAPGFYDFTGPRDIGRLFDEIERAGLWLIPHIGPWIGGDLDAGGVPVWALHAPGVAPACSSAVPPAPGGPFLRHVAGWWERLLPLLNKQPNLLMLALDPGQCAFESSSAGDEPGWLHRYLRPLLDLARGLGCDVPCAMPQLAYLQAADLDGAVDNALPFYWLSGEGEDATIRSQLPDTGVALLDLSLPLSWTEGTAAPVSRIAGDAYPRRRMAAALVGGAGVMVLSPVHTGAVWGRWSAPGASAVAGYGAPISGTCTHPDSYYQTKRMALTAESLGNVLAEGVRDPRFRTFPKPLLRPAVCSAAGMVVAVDGVEEGEPYVHLWGPDAPGSGEMIPLLEDISAPQGSVGLLPYAWRLSEGGQLTATLEPVLHTIVAGRELVIFRNEVGGEVYLPPDFRPRSRRGPIYAERDERGLSVHFDPARVASLVLDGATGVLQLLALDPSLSSRTWPLDDAWRKTPTYPAPWHPDPEEPARGVVIGPDFVLPQEDGGFRFLASDRGFGYRWGPWRGSDPNTWLAPFTWEGPEPISLPSLSWTSRPGAPEALPDYNDRDWRQIAAGAPLDMAYNHIDHGFAWYRARLLGRPTSITLVCRHAGDVFLNGVHVAALNPPPDYGEVRPRTLPLPARHLRDDNVVAILVENEGRPAAWNRALAPHGVVMCEFAGAQVQSWRIREGLTGETRVQGFHGYARWDLVGEAAGSAIVWHRATFDLQFPRDLYAPLSLYLDRTPTRCYGYLNGVLVARLRYPRDPQRRFWLPEGLLQRSGTNELLIAQWTRGAQPGIGSAALEMGTPLMWRREAAV